MSTNTKITLSPQELQLVNNSNWILTKRDIIEKVTVLFAQAAEKMKAFMEKEKSGFPEAVVRSEPKISKGENYRQLPYVMLDYPRCFEKGDIFAIRTMFWWGNFFSCTLHMAGGYKRIFEEALLNNHARMIQDDIYLCINADQWHHHFELDNYVAVKTKTHDDIIAVIQQRPFVKLALKFSLDQWHEMPEVIERSFSELIKLLKN